MSKQKKITMADIAQLAGVSQPTVSLVLNNSTSVKISELTKKKVLEASHSLGYQSKSANHSIGRTKKIAMLITDLDGYSPFIDAINSARIAAWENDYMLMVLDHFNDKEFAAKIESEMNNGDYAGMIYSSSVSREINQLKIKTHLPTVLLNCTLNTANQSDKVIPSVLPADMVGAYKAIAHLTSLGHRRIAMLTGESWMQANTHRIEGYRQALLDADIIPNDNYIMEANWSLKEAYIETLKLLDMKTPPDAIFCACDYMAVGCYQAIAERKLNIPQDIAVVGYDNQRLSADISPPLTTVDLPYAAMGKQSIELLIALVEGQPLLSKKCKIEGELIIRDSSKIV